MDKQQYIASVMEFVKLVMILPKKLELDRFLQDRRVVLADGYSAIQFKNEDDGETMSRLQQEASAQEMELREYVFSDGPMPEFLK